MELQDPVNTLARISSRQLNVEAHHLELLSKTSAIDLKKVKL